MYRRQKGCVPILIFKHGHFPKIGAKMIWSLLYFRKRCSSRQNGCLTLKVRLRPDCVSLSNILQVRVS
jgi:hypothetical protein